MQGLGVRLACSLSVFAFCLEVGHRIVENDAFAHHPSDYCAASFLVGTGAAAAAAAGGGGGTVVLNDSASYWHRYHRLGLVVVVDGDDG